MTKSNIILPNEILDIILNLYWQFKFKEVLDELTKPLILENKIIYFLKKYFFKKNLFQKKYLNDLIHLNNEIKLLENNKINKLICKINFLKLYYCYSYKDKYEIYKNIHQDLIYITIFSIANSGNLRYLVIHKFYKLSLII